jgi:hypothetical protein
MSKREDIVNLFMTPLKKINPGKALMVAIESNEQGILTFQNLVIMGEIIKPDFERETKSQLTS